MTVTYGTVCSGVEAASLAWEPLGWVPRWFAEVDAAPSRVLARRWPHVPNAGDMRGVAGLLRSGELPAVDVFAGGTPCQAFSLSGARGGLDDPRGALTRSFVEISRELPAAWIVWENVPGVLSDRTNAFGDLLGGLCGAGGPLLPAGGARWTGAGLVRGPGREVAWRVLDAQFFGLAQRRRRVWVVAGPVGGGGRRRGTI